MHALSISIHLATMTNQLVEIDPIFYKFDQFNLTDNSFKMTNKQLWWRAGHSIEIYYTGGGEAKENRNPGLMQGPRTLGSGNLLGPELLSAGTKQSCKNPTNLVIYSSLSDVRLANLLQISRFFNLSLKLFCYILAVKFYIQQFITHHTHHTF